MDVIIITINGTTALLTTIRELDPQVQNDAHLWEGYKKQNKTKQTTITKLLALKCDYAKRRSFINIDDFIFLPLILRESVALI